MARVSFKPLCQLKGEPIAYRGNAKPSQTRIALVYSPGYGPAIASKLALVVIGSWKGIRLQTQLWLRSFYFHFKFVWNSSIIDTF